MKMLSYIVPCIKRNKTLFSKKGDPLGPTETVVDDEKDKSSTVGFAYFLSFYP